MEENFAASFRILEKLLDADGITDAMRVERFVAAEGVVILGMDNVILVRMESLVRTVTNRI